jgi:hypothetical protein
MDPTDEQKSVYTLADRSTSIAANSAEIDASLTGLPTELRHLIIEYLADKDAAEPEHVLCCLLHRNRALASGTGLPLSQASLFQFKDKLQKAKSLMYSNRLLCADVKYVLYRDATADFCVTWE